MRGYRSVEHYLAVGGLGSNPYPRTISTRLDLGRLRHFRQSALFREFVTLIFRLDIFTLPGRVQHHEPASRGEVPDRLGFHATMCSPVAGSVPGRGRGRGCPEVGVAVGVG